MTLLDLLNLMRKHLGFVIAMPVVCAILMALVSVLLMANTYTADTTLYVLAQNADSSGTSLYSDLSASQMVANDVASLAENEAVQNAAARNLGLEDLDDFDISVSSETTSRIITLSVSGKDPEACAQVANALTTSIAEVAQSQMGVEAVNALDEARAPSDPSGPNRLLYTAVAFLGGLFVAIAVIVLLDMLNTKIRGADDAEELLGIPVIGRIPAMRTGR